MRPLSSCLARPLSRLEKYRNETRRSNTGGKWYRAVIGEYQRNTNRHQKTQRPGPANTYYIESPAAQVGMVWVLRLDGWIAWSIRKGAGSITEGASAVTMLGTAQKVTANGIYYYLSLNCISVTGHLIRTEYCWHLNQCS
jgi:hypothetical protein